MRIKPAQKTTKTVKTSDGLFGFSKDFSWEGSQVEPSRFFADNVLFRRFFLRAIFSPTARDISFFFSTIASDVLGIFYFTEVMVVSLYITKSGLQYVLCWTLLDNTWY